MLVLFPESIIRLPYLASLMLQSHDTFLEENSKWIRTRPTAMTNLIWSSEIFSQERKAKGDISHNTKSGKTIVTFKHNKAATCIHPTGHKFWVIMSNIMSFLLSHWRMASYSWMHLSWWREIPFLNLLFSKLKLIIGLQEYFDNMNKKQINQSVLISTKQFSTSLIFCKKQRLFRGT